MNYLIAILSILVVVLFLFTKHLYSENTILQENEKTIIDGYNITLSNLENKAKFEKEMIIEKEPVIKASERVKIENEKRGVIDEKSLNNDFIIVNF